MLDSIGSIHLKRLMLNSMTYFSELNGFREALSFTINLPLKFSEIFVECFLPLYKFKKDFEELTATVVISKVFDET